jgi:hypothetical protein
MPLKDWNKLGENRYKAKKGVGEVWITTESHAVPLVATAVRGPNAHRYGKVNLYTFYCHCYGNGDNLHPKTFNSKVKAHAHLMKYIKAND